ncbi:MAG: EamA family transporter [Acutalibacteraceae bacterium]
MWTVLVFACIILWGITSIFYKKGANKDDKYIHLKFSVIIGMVFFVIALCYIIIRDEPFSIWESAVRFWPVTAFGIIYAIGNTFTYKGFLYNDASVIAPIENTANGSYVMILIIVYAIIGKVGSIWEILTVYKIIGIACIFLGLLFLGIVQHNEAKAAGKTEKFKAGATALIFPLLFSVMDGLETVVSGVCLDKTLGYAMPEGDSIIIAGMEYAAFALAFWIYVSIKEKRMFNPFTKSTLPFVGGALCDNIAIVFYSYAMAIDSVATDPILAVYPVLTVLFSRIVLKETLSVKQYLCLALLLLGSVIIVIGQNV